MKNDRKKFARIIKQIQKGNKSAFEEFYKLTCPKAYFIALKITQNEQDAEDILQESYIKALEKINEIDTTQNINSWFLKIVANKSKNLLKSRNHFVFEGEEEKIFEDLPEETVEFSPEENLDQEELRLEVMAAIDELTDEKRACIMMMYFGDMSVKEIAESIDVPESTVKNRLYSARKELKTKFEKNGNILYGAALGGVLIWALGKTSATASAAFLASAASAEIVAGVTAAYSASIAATTGAGIAAKAVALSVAQKVAVGVAATTVIGGSTVGVVTVVKNSEEQTSSVTEEVTTAPVPSMVYVFNEITTPETTAEILSSTELRSDRTKPITERTSTREHTTAPESTTRLTTQKETTTKNETTTHTETTTQRETTTNIETTTQKETTTAQAETTATLPAETTTQATATLIIEVTDMDDSVVDTLNLTVEAGTEMTWDYLITLISANGYEAMAGVYGDGVGSVAQAGEVYTFTAEL